MHTWAVLLAVVASAGVGTASFSSSTLCEEQAPSKEELLKEPKTEEAKSEESKSDEPTTEEPTLEEPKSDEPKTDEEPKADEEAEQEEDMYANLPEQDEETSCSMCNTFRKGPCRPPWRKLEHCFKDHEDEENGAVKCMRYFKPHSDCLMQYTNLYHLISLDLKQEFVSDAVLAVTDQERQAWTVNVDWSNWIMFADEAGLDFEQTVAVDDKTTPLWERLPPNTEPVLVTVTAEIPDIQKETGLLLKAAYAIDQDGMVLGFTFSKEYGEKLHQVNADPSDEMQTQGDDKGKGDAETPKKENDEHEDPERDNMPFEFFIFPGSTTHVQVCALYAEDPVGVPASKNILDARLMESALISLENVAGEPEQETVDSLQK
jgi:hypothetical protein